MHSVKQVGLAVAALSLSLGLGHAESNITSDTHFYGLSEPVYPSRMSCLYFLSIFFTKKLNLTANGTGTGDWAEAYSKAAALVSQMTLEEKVCYITSLR